jgi:hypothetical protein
VNRSATFAILVLFAVSAYLLWQSYMTFGEFQIVGDRLGKLEADLRKIAVPGEKPRPSTRTRKPKEETP